MNSLAFRFSFQIAFSSVPFETVAFLPLFYRKKPSFQRSIPLGFASLSALRFLRFKYRGQLEKFYEVKHKRSTFCRPELCRRPFWIRCRQFSSCILLKEVIQPHFPVRLPCYDFIPITSLTFGGSLIAVKSPTSGKTGFHDVTGGVYKTRERIHGVVDDTPLLAIPASRSRIADSYPN